MMIMRLSNLLRHNLLKSKEKDILKNIIDLEEKIAISRKFEYTQKGEEKMQVLEATLEHIITGNFIKLSLLFEKDDFVNQERDTQRINDELNKKYHR